VNSTRTSESLYVTSFAESAPDNYERYFVPVIGGPLARDLVDAADVRPGARVLDVACGTGIVTRLAAERVGATGSVTGVDINAGMLTTARTAASAAAAPIRWHETSVEAMPLPDEAFDLVFCQLGLMFVQDKPAALREMRRVLVPGGRAHISVPRPSAFFEVLEQGVTRHVGAEAGAFVRMVFSLDPGLLQRLLQEAGYQEVLVSTIPKQVHLPPPAEFLWQYIQCTPLAATVAGLPEKDRAALEHDVVAQWRRWPEHGGMTYMQEITVATARK
jgi:ubiquinone/menaquinone biosynthesis C-methylase UbiE